MTSTTAALAALADGEHLVHRPRGVVHLYRGPLTASGRYAQRGPACGQRTNRLQLLEPPAGGPLDPAWTRRLCKRCEARLSRPATPVTREDWAPWDHLDTGDLAFLLDTATTLPEVDAVAFHALRAVGVPRMTDPMVWHGSETTLSRLIGARRSALDVEAAERRHAEAVRSRQITAQRSAGDARELAAEAENRARRTQNPVDRLKAYRHRQYADAETARARAS